MKTRPILLLLLVIRSAAGCGDSDRGSHADDMDAGTDADTDSDTDADTDADTETETETETETDTQCAGQWDFAPCDLVTAPDRSYDICVGGVCVSPGCGDWHCNVPGPHFPPPNTGQRLCYDSLGFSGDPDGGVDGGTADGGASCPPEGAALFGQDAQYGWDTTHDASERFTRDVGTAGEPVVADNVTGLEWQGCPGGISGDDCEVGTYTGMHYEDAVTYCDALTWSGLDDWRLPDEWELVSIADYGDPTLSAIDGAAFPATPVEAFWSSSDFEEDPPSPSKPYGAFRWCTVMGVLSGCSAPFPLAARCVRGTPAPVPPRFTRDLAVIDEPVVIDDVTGLEWQGCADGLVGDDCGAGDADTHPWAEALALCEGLSWAGRDDWRLPNAGELASIVDHRTHSPSIDGAAFPATADAPFWSSTSLALEPALYATSMAWMVWFDYGDVTMSDHMTSIDKLSSLHVRCVRGGE